MASTARAAANPFAPFAPFAVVLSRRRCLFAAVASTLLSWQPACAVVRVEWHISNAWQDEGCDLVCYQLGLWCTEGCWPASVAGVETLLQGPHVNGVCYAVERGVAQQWHPAKDPENSLCYQDPGNIGASTMRCPIRPITPSTQSMVERYIRRICPCVNDTTALYDSPLLDCGLGHNPIQPVVEPPYAGVPLPTPGIPPNAPTRTPTAAPATPPPTARSHAAHDTGSGCTRLCVDGFQFQDSTFNGEYFRQDENGHFKNWKQGHWAIQVLSNRWQILEALTPMTNRSVAHGTLVVMPNDVVPPNDFFITSTSGYTASFWCCPDGFDWSSGASAATVDEDDVDFSSSIASILVGVLVAIVVSAVVAMTLYLWWQSRKKGGRTYKEFKEPGREKLKQVDSNSSSQGRTTSADMSLPDLGSLHAREEAMGGQPRWDDKPNWPSHGGGVPGFGRPPPSGTMTPQSGTSASLQSVRRDDPFEDRGAAGVAAVLGRSAAPGHRGYEGPLNPWWGDERDEPQERFHDGSQVRVCGLTSQPTWNGAEGVVTGYDPGRDVYAVQMEDGRIKSVRPANLELASRPPRKDPDASYRTQPQQQQWQPQPQQQQKKQNRIPPRVPYEDLMKPAEAISMGPTATSTNMSQAATYSPAPSSRGTPSTQPPSSRATSTGGPFRGKEPPPLPPTPSKLEDRGSHRAGNFRRETTSSSLASSQKSVTYRDSETGRLVTTGPKGSGPGPFPKVAPKASASSTSAAPRANPSPSGLARGPTATAGPGPPLPSSPSRPSTGGRSSSNGARTPTRGGRNSQQDVFRKLDTVTNSMRR